MRDTWGGQLEFDPAYNPNLSSPRPTSPSLFRPGFVSMAENLSAARPEAAAYFFHLDAQSERVRFSSRLELTGWLFHRQGARIHGLRAVVRSRLRRDRIYPARRKRARPAIGAAYPGSAGGGNERISRRNRATAFRRLDPEPGGKRRKQELAVSVPNSPNDLFL